VDAGDADFTDVAENGADDEDRRFSHCGGLDGRNSEN